MAIKFLREIVVSSLATALVTAVYTHGSDHNAIKAPSAASPATSAGEEDQRPEGLARFQARIASAHVGKSSPPSPIVEAPAVDAASADSEPVWPPQGAAARPARAAVAGKAAALKPAASPAAASATESKPAPEPDQGAQVEAAPASYASRIADKFKDYVWNPSASVVNGVSSGWSTVTSKITSFVKKQPS
jgi:hypothetical protein